MSWLSRLWRSAPAPNPQQAGRLEAYRALPSADGNVPLLAQRYVVVDVETSGLHPYSDRLLAIGAVAVTYGLIRLEPAFRILLRQSEPSSHENILVHGIDGTAQTQATEPAEALLAFFDFAQNAPLVAFHADFDRVFVERAARSALGITPVNAWLDLAELAPAFFPEYASDAHTLDDWTKLFGIENYARHDALADALATAQLLQAVLARCTQNGVTHYRDLAAHQNAQRWLAGHRR